MVMGLRGKNRSGTIQIDYLIHIQGIKPWPPSQSLKSLRSVMIKWENGERHSGSTNVVSPSLGSVIGEGKIEFNESFRLPVTLAKDMSVRNGDADVFQKNCLEFNLYEPRRDKNVKGQLLGTAIIDLADCGILKETLRVSVPMNCKRNYRNTDQPLLFIKIQPSEKNHARSSLKDSFSKEVLEDNHSDDSVSALMNEEHAEEAAIASFTNDVSSHSSVAAVTASLESSGYVPPEQKKNGPIQHAARNDKEHRFSSRTWLENSNLMPKDTHEKLERSSNSSPSMDVFLFHRIPVNGHAPLASTYSSPSSSSVSTQMHVVSASADSSPPYLVYDNLGVNSKSRMGSSYHKSSDQDVCENVATCRNIVTDVQTNGNESTSDIYSSNTASQDSSHFSVTGNNPVSENWFSFETSVKSNVRCEEADKYCLNERAGGKIYRCSADDKLGNGKSNLDVQNCIEDEQSVQRDAKDQIYLGSTTDSLGGSNIAIKEGILRSERLKQVKSLRSPEESDRSIGLLTSMDHAEINEIGIVGDTQNSGGNIRSNNEKDAQIFLKEARSSSLDGKIEYLENKIKMLEGELREAGAIEAALYSIVAEHGSSMSKVHTPARRLSRLYFHACKENLLARKCGAAKSSISGLVLVTKACRNDVPRLTFWLSNSILLRTIISRTTNNAVPSNLSGSSMRRKGERGGHGKITYPIRSKGFNPGKNKNAALENIGVFGNWDDSQTYISALEKVESWIFSCIVESIWWQTLTPHMQTVHAKVEGSASRKNYRRMFSSCDQEQGNLSLDIWKNAFREVSERLCPVRAQGHECGCLPMLPRLIMEQCLARLDVAMFNAILRESADEIPADPVSDPISDPKVLPIPPGKSSFGAGALLKTLIGNWSRCLADLFGIDDDDSLEDKDDSDSNDGRQNTSFKSFHLLNALSDLLMLPKEMLLSASIRKEVCPMFSSSLVKKILRNFAPDEFCLDPVPDTVFEALDSKDNLEDGKEAVNNLPCIAASIVYSPPPVTSIASIIGEIGNKAQLRRSGSSVVRKSCNSDDELDELKFPLSSIFSGGSSSSCISTKPGRKSKETGNESPVRYELLRDVWRNSQ